MITDILLTWVRALLETIFSFLPQWTVTIPTEQIQGLVYEATKWNAIAPVFELFTIGGLVVTVFTCLVGFKFVKWVIDSIIAVIP
jgi:hypothetical protein